MTPDQFKAWRVYMNLTQAKAAELLELSKATIELYERGRRHEDERPVVIPKTVEMACWAFAQGRTEYEGPTNEELIAGRPF